MAGSSQQIAALSVALGQLDPEQSGTIPISKMQNVLTGIGIPAEDARKILHQSSRGGAVAYRDFLSWIYGGPAPSDAAVGRLQFLLAPMSRGSAFTAPQRRCLGLEGLLPTSVENLGLRARRWKAMLDDEPVPIKKYSLLSQLMATDLVLFYRVVVEHMVELMPVIYTPTVGEACMKFSRLYRSDVGMYISFFEHRGRVRELLDNWLFPVDIIVVTDGGRILGLGDLGTNGMGIPIGKIALYVAGGGFHPLRALPITLDCGTDRQEMLDDEFYLGAKRPRINDEDHAAFLEEFSMAVRARWPSCLLQYEDFATERAFAVLDNMRRRCLCFNDDIQGTGSVVLAGFINGMRSQGTPLGECRVVFFGAGSSAVGVATQIAQLLESEGLSFAEAKSHIYMIDTKGLITTSRGDKLPKHKQAFARTDGPDIKTLLDVVRHVKPHALFGLSGFGPAFERDVVEALCLGVERPLIFPLSNPTSKAEITAENAFVWSQGRCIFAAGSPFDPVSFEGRTMVPGQANNVLVFPGIGFGAWAVSASECADEFFIVAAKTLAAAVPADDIERGTIYPSIARLRELSCKVAASVATCAFDKGFATLTPRPVDMEAFIKELMYEPVYAS